MPSRTVLPVVLLVLQLRIDLLSSFTMAPSCTRTTTHWRQWRVLPKRVEEENQRHPWTLSMSNRRRRTNRDYEEEDEDVDVDYYYQDSARDYDDDYRDDSRDVDKDEDEDDYYNSTAYYTNNGNSDKNKNTSKNREGSSRRSQYNYYDDDDEKDDNEDDDDAALGDYPEDNYDDDSARSSISDASRGGYYQVSFTNNNDVDYSETEIDWEVCSSPGRNKKFPPALVVLPPAAVDRPKAIVHFVGGTVFGSNPRLWYGGLLESIVRSTSVAIVVTPIPVTLFRNPLQHVRLSNALAESLEHAWETVLEDEYGASSLEGVPLCGMGHSLGARLLTVLTTLDRNDPDPPVPAYKSLCLISFTNFGAKVGIPGVGALLKQSQKREAYNNNNNNRNNNRKRGGGQRSSRRGRSSTRARSRSRTGYDYDYDYDYDYEDDDYYDDLDEEWAEMVGELQETVNAQANRIQSALTPNPNQLEFFPTPDQLWRAVSSAEGDRYRVNTTLVVQFDDDPIDQGSKLATILAEGNASDVRFARLRGNHLTPVTVREEADANANGNTGANGNSNANSNANSKFAGGATPRRQTKKNPLLVDAGLQSVLAKTFRGTQTARRDKVALRDLKRSLVSYITDVVTK